MSSMATVLEPEVSRHKCLIYDGETAEQLPVVVPLLMDGLRDNYRCLYLGPPEMIRMVERALSGRGVDVPRETARGALLMSADRSHLEGGSFDPAAMIAGLSGMIDSAVADGFAGLCATGDMRWELGTDRNFERVAEYEAVLEELFQHKPLRGICQYHRDTVPSYAVRDALRSHRSVHLGDQLNRQNLFYLPPEVLKAQRHEEDQGAAEWMCQQIIRVMKAEQARDQALAALAHANRDLERRVAERTAELTAAN